VVIRSLPPDKASGPDDISVRFLQSTRPIIRLNVMATFDVFWHHDVRNLHNVNGALLTLLLKSAEAAALKDDRPTSLIIGMLISKVLTNRLASRLQSWFTRAKVPSSRAVSCMIISGLFKPRLSYFTCVVCRLF
jgi:hypothetical protein